MVMTSLVLTKVSVVVRSQGNNPRILNPDFLTSNGIVPSGWKPVDVTVLQPLAWVRYTNGVQINLETENVQFTANAPSECDWAEDLPRMPGKRGNGRSRESVVEAVIPTWYGAISPTSRRAVNHIR